MYHRHKLLRLIYKQSVPRFAALRTEFKFQEVRRKLKPWQIEGQKEREGNEQEND
jgi:hypothetical protein